jgi:basic membrane protein A
MRNAVFGRILLACVLIATGLLAQGVSRLAVAQDDPLRVAFVVNGTLGDRSFFDSAAEGIERMRDELNVEADILEASYDRARWEPALADAADADYDVIIVAGFDMVPFLTEIAPLYPEKRFILFDEEVDYSTGCCDNVYSIQYQTSEASYLAGYAAASISESGMLGTVVGAEIRPIQEFTTGFTQGAEAANPDVEILQSVVGGANPWSDPAKGKELALAQIQQGADVMFPIAGGSGIGSLQAARDEEIVAIGVDSDQAAIFAETDPTQAEVIMTSVLKNVGQSLFLAVEGTINGTTEYGTVAVLGLADGAVGIVEDENWERIVPEDVRAEVDELRQQIIDGELEVEKAIE